MSSNKWRSRFAERQPVFWAALAFALGILAGAYLRLAPVSLSMAGAVASVAALATRNKKWLCRISSLVAVLTVGALAVTVHPPSNAGSAILPYADHTAVLVTAHITREGDWQEEGQFESRLVVNAATESVETGNGIHAVQAGLRLSIYAKAHESQRDFSYGQRIRFPAKLLPPRSFHNPGAFDYRTYLNDNGITVLGSCKQDAIEVLPGLEGSWLERWRAVIHRSVLKKIHTLWRPAEASLMDAMVVGDENFVDHESRLDFQRTGTYHLLVVSGMNVGILAFVTFWILRRVLRANEAIASGLTIAITAAYAFVTYVGPPVWRATLMLTLFLGARLLYRERSMLNAIGIAALGVLAADPQALFGASFQMTFLSVIVIAGIGVPVLERTSQPFARGLRQLESLAYDRSFSPRVAQFRLDLRLIIGRMKRFAGNRCSRLAIQISGRSIFATLEVLFISLLMQLGMALPMAYYFHRVTVTALPANILVVPFTEIMMPAAAGAVALGYLWNGAAKVPALAASLCLDAIARTVHLLGRLRLADLRVPTPSLTAMVFAAAAVALAIALARRRTVLAGAGLVLLAASAFWIVVFPPRPELSPNLLEITAIDVGQGDSLFLAFPNGQTALVDAGGMPQWMHSEFDIGEQVVSPYLWSRRIHRLDAVEVTHPHADHIGGMYAILANFRPRELWIGPHSSEQEPAMMALVQEANELGIRVIERQAGDSFQFGGTTIRILAPNPGPLRSKRRENETSVVMKVTYRATSALLEGDAEKAEERLVAKEQPEADVLKVAHHGSTTSTIPELLAAVHPRFAVISVGAYNGYGHPRAEVLDRLTEAGITTYRTDLDGAVTFLLDGKEVASRTFLPQKQDGPMRAGQLQ